MPRSAFAHLLSPIRIGSMSLNNRIAVTAMGASFGEPDGTCGERLIAYHENQARGGAGLIITGVAGVAWPSGASEAGQMAISHDRFIPSLTALTERVHAAGGRIAAQLHHGGPSAMDDMVAGRPLWCPSPPEPRSGDFTEAFLLEELAAAPFGRLRGVELKVMTIDDIRAIVDQFAAGAKRARRAGFDGVEIHGAHGYLLSAFLSARSNKRTDEYGGTFENRARLLVEVIRAVRAAAGSDMAVWCKLDSREIGKVDGITIEDAIATARLAETAGVDAVTVSAYHDPGQGKLHSGSHTPHEPGLNIPFAARIKAAVGVPVIASGRIDPARGEAAIADGSLDVVAMGRLLLADPHLPNKLAAGRPADVLPCIYCYTCISAIYLGQALRCAVNPETGLEYRRLALAPRSTKRVVVIGGGPAGMEAARRLDRAGQEVILLEASARLGGTLPFASLAYPANEPLLDWLRRQVAASGADVRLGTSATPDLIRSLRPDAVIVATGARRDMPPIPGSDLPNVLSGDDMRKLMLGENSADLKRKTSLVTRIATRLGAATGLTANLAFVRAATHRWMPLGDHVVIVGGELVGLELAEFLCERGRTVTVVDEASRFGAGLLPVRRMRLLEDLREHGVAMFPKASDIRIEPGAVAFTDGGGASRRPRADHVIVAKGAIGDQALADALRAEGLAVHAIGDCTGVRYIEGAMRGAAEAVEAILT